MVKTDIILHVYYDPILPLSFSCDKFVHDVMDVSILISILQTFRSLSAISHLRPPMEFLSQNSFDTSDIYPLMNIYSEGGATFK